MKAVMGFLTLVVIVGVVYGLAFFGVIPTKALAAKSPAIGKMLVAMHLSKKTKPKKSTVVAAAPPASSSQQMLDAEKQQLDAQRSQLDQDKAAFEAQQKQALSSPASSATAQPDTDAKLIALYNTMDPDNLAQIFAKLPDPQVVSALMKMDEKQSGKVFGALPPARAAKLSQIMAMHSGPPPATVAASPGPAASL